MEKDVGKSTFLFSVFKFLVISPFLGGFYDFRVAGRENLPSRGPAVFVCKHQSWVDLFAISSSLPIHPYYIAKQELFTNILGDFHGKGLAKIGKFASSLTNECLVNFKAIPVDRDIPQKMLSSFKVMKDIIFCRKGFLVLFPEGKIVKGEVGEFKSGIIEMIVRFQRQAGDSVAFLPVGISYGKNFFKKKLNVDIGAPEYFEWDDESSVKILEQRVTELTKF